jgi:hypothetical protein
MKLEYGAVGETLHSTLADYLDGEIECLQNGEFDYELEEIVVGYILHLIREQGGSY